MKQILNGIVHGKTIELTDTANLPDGQPVRVQVLTKPAPGNKEAKFAPPEAMRIAQEAFIRDLPKMLRDRRFVGRWVLYQQNQRLTTGTTQRQVLRYFHEHGLDAAACYIDKVIERSKQPELVDPSFFESET